MGLCLNAFWGNASSPCLNTECSLWWILRTGGHLFISLSAPPQDSPFRLLQMVKGISPPCVLGAILPRRAAWNHTRCALAQRFRNTPWHLACIFVLLVQDDSPAKQFLLFLASIFACRHPQKLSGKLSGPKAAQIFLIPLCLLWDSPHGSSGGNSSKSASVSFHLREVDAMFLPVSYLMYVCIFRLSWARGLQGHSVWHQRHYLCIASHNE